MYGISSLPSVPVHGRTDTGILHDIFDHHGLDFEPVRKVFFEQYCQRLEEHLPRFSGRVLPGVESLLASLAADQTVSLGLLTGNCQRAAQTKLEFFGLHQFFGPMGGFGDQTTDRNQVARQAFRACRAALGSRFQPERLWVVGDTVHDIRCGRAIGARVLAVATGGDSLETLRAQAPDLLLPDLTDPRSIIAALVKT